ncbi:RebB family R body protein [Rhodovibrionaceae bacterium A322]
MSIDVEQAAFCPPPEFVEMGEAQMVNRQITDAVAQTNVKVVGEAPAVAMAQNYLAASQANAILYANMVNNQQQLAIAGQASMVEGVIRTLRPNS